MTDRKNQNQRHTTYSWCLRIIADKYFKANHAGEKIAGIFEIHVIPFSFTRLLPNYILCLSLCLFADVCFLLAHKSALYINLYTMLEPRFRKKDSRDTYQHAINNQEKFDRDFEEMYGRYADSNQSATRDDFLKEEAELHHKGQLISPKKLSERAHRLTQVVATAARDSHLSSAAVGMLGGTCFLGGFYYIFIPFVIPYLLPAIPSLGCVATFLMASTLNKSLCAAGSFLLGFIISAFIHGRIYPYASRPPEIQEQGEEGEDGNQTDQED
ncbi:MAG: hypothetical protein LBI34_01420 [Puniceicoccales bacterium]|jgi:hypothetical protein|nr:hypothetical protein [Puniceicoccales bacterium]